MNAEPGPPETLPEFQRYQFAFASRIRDPKTNPRPRGVPARRMKVYEELVFSNFQSFVSVCFPVARSVLGKRRWARLMREFFRDGRCHTPFFRQIPEQFVKWFTARGPQAEEPDFLPHLLHYEWVELAADVSNREPEWERVDRDGDLLEGRPALNPVSFLLTYPYPVHLIGPRFKPTAAQQETTYLLVFRNLEDETRFVVLNPVSARLLDLVKDGALTGRAALESVAAELGHPDPEVVLRGGLDVLENLRAEQALLGTLK